LGIKAIKESERPNLEQQAAASGKTLVELERERRYIYSDAKTHNKPAQSRNQGKPNFNHSQNNNPKQLYFVY
jgi:hypothetical protein